MNFNNTYSKLPEKFYQRTRPVRVHKPKLIKWNLDLAEKLNLHFPETTGPELADVFSGNKLLEGSDPIAQAYAGHQFGHFVPRLGDGRALLLGEVLDVHGNRFDIQLKGSGRTFFSRGGDGRAGLGPMMREYLVSEGIYRLGIPTTRSLAIVETGEMVEREIPERGAILTRVAMSHIRIGTFEYFAAQGDIGAIQVLADYVIERHFPHLINVSNRILKMYEEVVDRHARLVSQWMSVGFIHGVMNTDNALISGETIDYGPCAFLDNYQADKVFSSIDRYGRYAFSRQPEIAEWNLGSLGSCLLPLVINGTGNPTKEQAIEKIKNILSQFQQKFFAQYSSKLLAKIGIHQPQENDFELIQSLLNIMEIGNADFTLTFRNLAYSLENENGSRNLIGLFEIPEEIRSWQKLWRQRLAQESRSQDEIFREMLMVNPAYIPRNHLVEKAIREATEKSDFTFFETLLEAISEPFKEKKHLENLSVPPKPHEIVTQTFCGT